MQARTGAPELAPSLDVRIVDAALRCLARWGVSKTTLDDIAREAGCSRATIYRSFPGGKDTLLLAVATYVLDQFAWRIDAEISIAESLEDALVLGLTQACRSIREQEALQYLLEHEPEAIYPLISFDAIDPLLKWSADFATPRLARFVSEKVASEIGEWLARLIISYEFAPSTIDLTDEPTARRFVRTYVIAAVVAPIDLEAALARPWPERPGDEGAESGKDKSSLQITTSHAQENLNALSKEENHVDH